MMTRRGAIGGLLAATFWLSACTIPSTGSDTAPTRSSATKRPAATPKPEVAATPTPGPTATPTATPTPAPTATPTPSVPMRLLSGLVKIDANYIVSTGGGNIISTGGGNIIATGGGNIIAAGGGNIIAAGGGNIIAAGGGNIIAAGGGNIISTGGGNYRALETAAVPVGTMLPIQGMAVVAVSLTTGKPIGPVVVSDEQGAYQVPVPESVTDNVLIFAALPAKDEESARKLDPRLRYAAVVSPTDGTTVVIDEDEALLTKYTLTAFTGRLREIMSQSEADFPAYLEDLFANRWQDVSDLKSFVTTSLTSLHAEGVKAGVPDKPLAEQHAIAQSVADALLAHVKLKDVMLQAKLYDLGGYGYTNWENTKAALTPEKSVLTHYRPIMKRLREQVALKMAGGTFPETNYLKAANARRAGLGLPPYEIKRPSDFGDYFAQEYMGTNVVQGPEETNKTILTDIGCAAMPESGLIVEGMLRAGQLSILYEMMKVLITNSTAQEAVFEVVRQSKDD